VYRRVVLASLGRVWENVLDWEHLPWLHRSSFRSIALESASREGWRARVGLAGGPAEVCIEVELDRARLRYRTRTALGPGAGTEIWTRLAPAGPSATRIEVEFLLPGRASAPLEEAGAAYARLYERLWDEDEAMMRRRAAVLEGRRARAAAPGPADAATRLPLGPAAVLRAGLPRIVEAFGERLRLIALGPEIVAHAAVCPHFGGPLEDAEAENGRVRCPWHGYVFELADGRCAERRLRLAPRARVEVDPRSGEAFLHRQEDNPPC
jgi:nitrite reductase/ring-hydroxylating ferredoxin subunit